MIILHGDNQIASRSELTEQKRKALVIDLVGDTLDLATLVHSCSAVDLFGQSSLVIIEGLFSRRSSITKKQLVDYLSHHPDLNVVIWESKDVSVQLKNFPPRSVKKFALPQHIFSFLDTLALPNLQLALNSVPSELVLSLLSSHLHKLLLVKSSVGTFPQWQQSKLAATAKRFTWNQLVKFQSSVLEIDYLQKTGNLPSSLAQSLEVLIATL